MNFPNCLTQPNADCTFCGAGIAQTWNDLAYWEAFLDRHPVKSILELGTWRGGMAIFLARQCLARGAEFRTIDHANIVERPDLILADAPGAILTLDLFSETGYGTALDLLAALAAPRLLFCDNGDKRREVILFGPVLGPGDFLAVHDWDREIGAADIPARFLPVMQTEAEASQSLTRFFVAAA